MFSSSSKKLDKRKLQIHETKSIEELINLITNLIPIEIYQQYKVEIGKCAIEKDYTVFNELLINGRKNEAETGISQQQFETLFDYAIEIAKQDNFDAN